MADAHKVSMCESVDILEDKIKELSPILLDTLLLDHTTHKNIFWATDNYAHKEEGYQYSDEITSDNITGKNTRVLRPRVKKSEKEQQIRIKQKAEVFTPAWICNAQINLIDNAWFGTGFENQFNIENNDKTWSVNDSPIQFPECKNWIDYIRDHRLEIACGEGPYITSRYDTVQGNFIPTQNRIGILDRKLRVVSENTKTSKDWLKFAYLSLKCTYGYEWQGDNLLLAREAALYTFIEHYVAKFNRQPKVKTLISAAYIISWNLWQMDGLTCCIPNSCHKEPFKESPQLELFPDLLTHEPELKLEMECPGCKSGNILKHNGIPCLVAEWKIKGISDKNIIEFRTLIK